MTKVKSFLTADQEANVIKAIQEAEKQTSGEIRIHIEDKTGKPTLERAKEVFLYLKMDQTKQRNGVLLYVGISSKQFAILGDVGIDKVLPNHFWEEETQLVTDLFSHKKFEEGLVQGVDKIAKKLIEFFPYQADDANELPDTISKG